jgi:hypothetical protein
MKVQTDQREYEKKNVVVKHVEKGVIMDSESKCISGYTWQKCYNENVMVKLQLQFR